MNLSKNAIGNLINRYKAVLKKCHLLNTFGSLAVAGMLVTGSLGFGVSVVGAAALDEVTAITNSPTLSFESTTNPLTLGAGESATIGSITGTTPSTFNGVDVTSTLTIAGATVGGNGLLSGADFTVSSGKLLLGVAGAIPSPLETYFQGDLTLSAPTSSLEISYTTVNMFEADGTTGVNLNLQDAGSTLDIKNGGGLVLANLTHLNNNGLVTIGDDNSYNGFESLAFKSAVTLDEAQFADMATAGKFFLRSDGIFRVDDVLTISDGDGANGVELATYGTIAAKGFNLDAATTFTGGSMTLLDHTGVTSTGAGEINQDVDLDYGSFVVEGGDWTSSGDVTDAGLFHIKAGSFDNSAANKMVQVTSNGLRMDAGTVLNTGNLYLSNGGFVTDIANDAVINTGKLSIQKSNLVGDEYVTGIVSGNIHISADSSAADINVIEQVSSGFGEGTGSLLIDNATTTLKFTEKDTSSSNALLVAADITVAAGTLKVDADTRLGTANIAGGIHINLGTDAVLELGTGSVIDLNAAGDAANAGDLTVDLSQLGAFSGTTFTFNSDLTADSIREHAASEIVVRGSGSMTESDYYDSVESLKTVGFAGATDGNVSLAGVSLSDFGLSQVTNAGYNNVDVAITGGDLVAGGAGSALASGENAVVSVAGLTGAAKSTIKGTSAADTVLNLSGNGDLALSEGGIDVTVGTLNLGWDGAANAGAGEATAGGTLQGDLVLNGVATADANVNIYGTTNVTVEGEVRVETGTLEVANFGRLTVGSTEVSKNVTIGKDGATTGDAIFNINGTTTIHGDLNVTEGGAVTTDAYVVAHALNVSGTSAGNKATYVLNLNESQYTENSTIGAHGEVSVDTGTLQVGGIGYLDPQANLSVSGTGALLTVGATSAGTVRITGDLSIANGGKVDFTAGSFTVSGNLSLGATGVLHIADGQMMNATNGTTTIDTASIDFDGDNTSNNGGTLFTKTLTNTADMTLTDGTINADSIVSTKNITLNADGAGATADDATLTVNRGGTWTAGADISVTKGTLNVYTGAGLDVSGETLTVATDGIVNLGGATLTLDFANAGTIADASTYELTLNTTQFAGDFTLTVNNESNLIINDVNTYGSTAITEDNFNALRDDIAQKLLRDTTIDRTEFGSITLLGVDVAATTLSGVNSDYSTGKDSLALGAGDLTYNLHDTVISHINNDGTAASSTVKNGASLTLTGKGLTAGSTLLSDKAITVSGNASLTLGAEGGAATSTFIGDLSAESDGSINVTNTNLTQSGNVVLNGGLLHVANGAKLTSTGLSFDGTTSRMDIAGEYTFTGDFDAINTSFVADLSATPRSGEVGVDGVLEIDGSLTNLRGDVEHTGTIKATNLTLAGNTSLDGGNIDIVSANAAITLAEDFGVKNAASTVNLNAGSGSVNTQILSAQAGSINITGTGTITTTVLDTQNGSATGGSISLSGGTVHAQVLSAGSGSITVAASDGSNDSNIGLVAVTSGSVTIAGATKAALNNAVSITGSGSFNVEGTAQVDSNGVDIDLGTGGVLSVAASSLGFDISGTDLTSKVENFGVLDQTSWTMTDAGTVAIDLTGNASADTNVLLTTTLTNGAQLLSVSAYDALINSVRQAIFGAESGSAQISIAGISQDRTLTSISTGSGAVQVINSTGVIGAGTFSRSDANTIAGIVAPLTGGSTNSIIDGTGTLNLTGNAGIALSEGNITVNQGTLNLGYDGTLLAGTAVGATQGGTLNGALTINGTGSTANIHGENVIIQSAVNLKDGALNVQSGSGLTVYKNVTVGAKGSTNADFNVDSATTIYGDLIIGDKGTVTVTHAPASYGINALAANNLTLGGSDATNKAVFTHDSTTVPYLIPTNISAVTTVNAFGELNVIDGAMSTTFLAVADAASAKVHIASGETLHVGNTAEFKHDTVDIGAGTLFANTLRLSHAGATTLTGGIFNMGRVEGAQDIILDDAGNVATDTQLNFNKMDTWVSSSNLTVIAGMVDVGANASIDFATNDKTLSVATGGSLDFTGGTVTLDLANVGSITESGGDFVFTDLAAADKKLNGTLTGASDSFLNIDVTGINLAVTQGEYEDMVAAAKIALGSGVDDANIRFTGLSLNGTIDDLDYVFSDLGTDYVNKQLQAGTLIHLGNTVIAGIKADNGSFDSSVNGSGVKLTLTGMDAADGTAQDVLSQGNVHVQNGGELVLGYASADGTLKSPEQLYFDGDITLEIIGELTFNQEQASALTVEYSNVIMGEKPASGAGTVTHTVNFSENTVISVNNGATLQTMLDDDANPNTDVEIGGHFFDLDFNIGTEGNSTSTLKVMHDLTFDYFGAELELVQDSQIGSLGVLDVDGTVTFNNFVNVQFIDGAVLAGNAFTFHKGILFRGGNIKVDHNADTTFNGHLIVNHANSNVIIHVTDGVAGNEIVTTNSALTISSGTLDVQAGTLDMGGALNLGAGGILKVASGATVDLSDNAFIANLNNFGTLAYDATDKAATFTELTSKLVQNDLMGDGNTSVILNATEATGLLLDATKYDELIHMVAEALFGSGTAVNDITIAGVSQYRTLTSVSTAGTAVTDAYGVVGAGSYSLNGTSTFAAIVEDYNTGTKDSVINGSANTVLNLTAYSGRLLSEGSIVVQAGSVNLGFDPSSGASGSATKGGAVYGDLIVGDGSMGANDAFITSYGDNVSVTGNVHVHADGVLQVADGSFTVQGASGIDLDGPMSVEAGAGVYANALSFDSADNLKKLSGAVYINNAVALPMAVIDFDGDATKGGGGGYLQAQSFDFIADTTISDGHLAITDDMSSHKKLTLHAIGTAAVATDAQFSVMGGTYTANAGADVTVTKGTLSLSDGAVMDLQYVDFTALGFDAKLNIHDDAELIVDHKTIGLAENLSQLSAGPTVSYEAGSDSIQGTVSIMGLHAKTIDMSAYSGAGTVAEYDVLHNAGLAAFGHESTIDYKNITLTNTHKIELNTVAVNNMTGLGSSVVNVGSGQIAAGQVANVGYVAQSNPPTNILNEGTLYINGGPLADGSTPPEYLFVGDITTKSSNLTNATNIGTLGIPSKLKGNIIGAGGTQMLMDVAVEGDIDRVGSATTLRGNCSVNNIHALVDGTLFVEFGTTTVSGTVTVTEISDIDIKNQGVLKANIMDIETKHTINVGSNIIGGQGSIITNKADFNATTVLGDSAWSTNAALNVIGAASSLIVQEFYDASDATGSDDRINGRLIAGQNAYMLFGTTDTSLPLQVFSDANSKLVWGNGVNDISAALFLTKAQTLNAATGGVLVDGGVVNGGGLLGGAPSYLLTGVDAGAPTDSATFASNSLLVIDAGESGVYSNGIAALSGDTSTSLGAHSTLNVAANAKLYVMGGKGGELIVADSFELGNIITSGGQTGWSGDNLLFSSQTMDVATGTTGVHKNAAGQHVLQVNASVANTNYGHLFQSGAANYLNTHLLNGVGLDTGVDAPAGRKFLSIALTEDLGFQMGETDGRRTVRTIESAGQMASLGNVAKAVMSSNWAAQGAVLNRNSFAALDVMNSGEGSGSMTLNNGKVSVQTGENGGNGTTMADNAGFGVWLTPLYKWNIGNGFKGGAFEHAYDMGLGGIAVGADYTKKIDAETAFRVGLSLNLGAGYSDSSGDFNETSNDFSFWGLNLYGAFQKENFVATLDFGFTSTANELNQDLPSIMGMGNLQADLNAFAFSAGLNLEYTFNVGIMDITPHAGVRFMSVTTESYDIDSSLGRVASVGEDTQNVWYFPVGVTFSTDVVSENGWKFTPKLDLGILAAAGDLDATSSSKFTGVPGSMELNMGNVDGFAFNGGLGFELSNEEKGISIGLNYTLTAGEKDTSHMVFANFRYDF